MTYDRALFESLMDDAHIVRENDPGALAIPGADVQFYFDRPLTHDELATFHAGLAALEEQDR